MHGILNDAPGVEIQRGQTLWPKLLMTRNWRASFRKVAGPITAKPLPFVADRRPFNFIARPSFALVRHELTSMQRVAVPSMQPLHRSTK